MMNLIKPKKINLIVLFSILIIFTGCFTKYNLITKNPYENTIKISGIVKEISITDLRQDVSERKIRIPIMTLPGMKDEVSPILKEGTKNLIKTEIGKQFSEKTDTSYIVVINIKKALIGFRAYAFSEKQYTNAELEIITTDQFGNTKNYLSNVYLENKSLDASPQYTSILLERGLINAIHKCFNTNMRR